MIQASIRRQCRSVLILALLAVPCVAVTQPEKDKQPKDNIRLPDFTRTYGFDIRPDVKLYKTPKKPLTSKQRLKAFRKKLKNKFKSNRNGTKYGVQSYTKYSGTKRYGIGLSKKLGRKDKHGVTFHDHGVNYERDKSKYKYYLGIDTRNPIDRPDKEDSTYMFFGIKVRW